MCLAFAAYDLQKAFAVFLIRHIARREMSRHRMIVIIEAVDSADERVISVIVTLGHGRRAYKRFRNRISEKNYRRAVARIVARNQSQREHDYQNGNRENAQNFFHIYPFP